MTKDLLTVLLATVVSVGLLFAIGCESDAQTGALVGAGAGALAGQAIGRNTTSTLIGTAVGGGAGYIIGNEQDKKKAAAQSAQTSAQMEQMQQQMNTVTVNITNSNGSITPVTLRRQGVVYIGPRGETYPTLPTEEQLKQAGYGF
jgi:outer membrane lipoprotein SlyB